MPNVPPSPCHQPGCPNLRPCPNHQPKPWDGHRQRRRTLGLTLTTHQEQHRRQRILKRDHHICHICNEPDADQVDHITPLTEGGTDTDDNLAAIHSKPCHETKTKLEAARARARAAQARRDDHGQ